MSPMRTAKSRFHHDVALFRLDEINRTLHANKLVKWCGGSACNLDLQDGDASTLAPKVKVHLQQSIDDDGGGIVTCATFWRGGAPRTPEPRGLAQALLASGSQGHWTAKPIARTGVGRNASWGRWGPGVGESSSQRLNPAMLSQNEVASPARTCPSRAVKPFLPSLHLHLPLFSLHSSHLVNLNQTSSS